MNLFLFLKIKKQTIFFIVCFCYLDFCSGFLLNILVNEIPLYVVVSSYIVFSKHILKIFIVFWLSSALKLHPRLLKQMNKHDIELFYNLLIQ